MTGRRIISGCLIVAATAAAACAHRAAPPTVKPALSGRWVLATGGSQADTAALASGTAETPRPSGSGDRRGGYGGREGGYSGRSFDPGAMRGAMEAVRRGDARVTISEGDGSVHLEYADGSYFDLRTDGRKQDDIWRGVGRVRVAAYWSAAGLVLERKLEETDVTVTQTFARPAGGPRLTITTAVKGAAPRPLTMRREYALAEASASSTP